MPAEPEPHSQRGRRHKAGGKAARQAPQRSVSSSSLDAEDHREYSGSLLSRGSRLRMASGSKGKLAPAAFPGNRYEYEWHEPSFFNKVEDTTTDRTGDQPLEGHMGVRSPLLEFAMAKEGTVSDALAGASRSKSIKDDVGADKPSGHAMRVWALNLKLERFVLMEVAWGTHQLVELSAADVIKRVRLHTFNSVGQEPRIYKSLSQGPRPIVGELTYRDIRQVFSEGQRNPSLEIRRNCIVLCLPPLIALVFHDRCVFMVNEDIDTDSLLLRLEDITSTYSAKVAETEAYYLSNRSEPVSPQVHKVPLATVSNLKATKSMLFGAEHTEPFHNQPKAPRFVSFPLEFAMLEILISSAFEALNSEIDILEDRQDKVMSQVMSRKQPKPNDVGELHEIKAPVEVFSDRIRSLGKAFRDVLASEEDMSYMELTKLFYRPELYIDEQGEPSSNPNLEILLEFFDQEIDQFDRRGRKLLRAIDNAERYVNLKMALVRNELVFWELTATIITVGLGAGSCISGTFGMNLVSRLEENPFAFFIFTGCIILCCIGGLVATGVVHYKYR